MGALPYKPTLALYGRFFNVGLWKCDGTAAAFDTESLRFALRLAGVYWSASGVLLDIILRELGLFVYLI